MGAHEKDVRAAARRLHAAIMAARRAGLAIAWPSRAEDLPALAISETGRARPDAPAAVAAAPEAPSPLDQN